jgi:hypothetical protein
MSELIRGLQAKEAAEINQEVVKVEICTKGDSPILLEIGMRRP